NTRRSPPHLRGKPARNRSCARKFIVGHLAQKARSHFGLAFFYGTSGFCPTLFPRDFFSTRLRKWSSTVTRSRWSKSLLWRSVARTSHPRLRRVRASLPRVN